MKKKTNKKPKYKISDVHEFVVESNAIENVFSEQANEDGYSALYEAIQLLGDGGCTPNKILKVHAVLLKNIDSRIAGQFRNVDVYIGNRKAPSPDAAKLLLDRLCIISPSPVTEGDIRQWHIDFEYAHPFEGGNGRVGRILMCAQWMLAGLTINMIHADLRKGGEEQKNYYSWFSQQ